MIPSRMMSEKGAPLRVRRTRSSTRRSGLHRVRLVDSVQPIIEGDARLRRVDRFVRAHLSQTIRLSDVAARAALSRTYFSTYFRNRTGVSFQNWLQRVRVDRALELMRDPRLSLSEIAYRCGLVEARTFQRAFVRQLGLSPSMARRHARSPE